MADKLWYESKTTWFGILWVIVGIAALFGYNDFQPTQEQVQFGGVITTIAGFLIVLFRKGADKKVVFFSAKK